MIDFDRRKIAALTCILGLSIVSIPARGEQSTTAIAQGADIASLLELGVAAESRTPVPNWPEALRCYQAASALGSATADYYQGVLYETGDGVGQSYVIARECYERAIARGFSAANLRLGLFYLEGWGVKQDRAQALKHVGIAAETGYIPAMNVLSDMYFAGIGTAKDLKQALVWAERAAKQDDPSAELKLGHILHLAKASKADQMVAREWYQLSAEQEYSDAMVAMASTFRSKGGSAEEHAVRDRWLKLAVDSGSGEAAMMLAALVIFEAWPGDPTVSDRCRGWLERSAQMGTRQASEALCLVQRGQSLETAIRYVLLTSEEQRYIARQSEEATKYANSSTHPPQIIRMARPVYPPALVVSQESGSALVEFIVDTTGRVRDPKVVNCSHPAFGDSALQAVQHYRFLPGQKNGQLQCVLMQMPFEFEFSFMPEVAEHPMQKSP